MKPIIVLICLLPLMVMADARIEIDQNGIDTFHTPWDALNTDNESKSMPQSASSFQYDDGGVYYGQAYTRTLAQLAWLRIMRLYGDVTEIVITSEEVNETGTLQVDGTNYTCRDWVATHRLLEPLSRTDLIELAQSGGGVEIDITTSLSNCAP